MNLILSMFAKKLSFQSSTFIFLPILFEKLQYFMCCAQSTSHFHNLFSTFVGTGFIIILLFKSLESLTYVRGLHTFYGTGPLKLWTWFWFQLFNAFEAVSKIAKLGLSPSLRRIWLFFQLSLPPSHPPGNPPTHLDKFKSDNIIAKSKVAFGSFLNPIIADLDQHQA